MVIYRQWQGPLVPAYQVQLRPLVQNVVATGRVIATSRAQVGSEITGVVLERRFKEGDRVVPGDILVVLRAEDLEARVREAQATLEQLQRARRPQAQAALRQAESQLAQARREAQRRAELLRSQAVSRESREQADQLLASAQAAAQQARLEVQSLAPGQSEESMLKERLAAARAALARTVIRSQVQGTVLTRSVEPGDLVQPGRVLLEIARSGATELLVPVDEKNLSVLRLGQRAKAVADAYPSRPFDAIVSLIAPSVDAQRGTVDIRLGVDPAPEFLLEDMTVTINVLTGSRDEALVVPNDALGDVSGSAATVLLGNEGRVRRIPVQLGLQSLVMTEVVSGLEPGDWILVDRNHGEGKRVRLMARSLVPAPDERSGSQELPMRMD